MGIGLVSIFFLTGIIPGNMEIQIENENVKIYSNLPYAPQIVDACKDDIHCSVNALNTLAKLEDEE